MVRLVLVLTLIVFIARAFWRVVGGIVEGVGGIQTPRVPASGVPMARDPVCGTFVVPERALALAKGRRQIYFCSSGCRDKYRARIA